MKQFWGQNKDLHRKLHQESKVEGKHYLLNFINTSDKNGRENGLWGQIFQLEFLKTLYEQFLRMDRKILSKLYEPFHNLLHYTNRKI